MKLSINILIEKMGHYDIRLYTEPDSEPELDSPRLLGNDSIIEYSNYLYVCYAKDIPNICDIEPGNHIACIGIPDGFSDENPPNVNLMIVNENITLDTLFNEILDIFLYFNQWEMHIQDLILNNSNLQDFVDSSDKILGWPISIIDRAEKTLAVSKHEESDDVIWKEICNGYIHTELLVKDSIKITEIMNYDKPIQRYSTVSERIMLSQAIRVGGHVVGFVAAHHPKKSNQYFSHGIVQLVNYFTNFIAKRMHCEEFYTMSRGSMFEYLLVDLIKGHIKDNDTITDRLEFLNWNLDKGKILLRIEASPVKLNFLRDHMYQVILQSNSIIYNGGLAVIVSGLDADGLSESVMERLDNFLSKNQAQCGISNLFTSLTKTEKYYKQAKIALNFGKIQYPDNIVNSYSKYAFHHAISILAQYTDVTDFYHNAFKLFLPLTKTNSILFDTLRIYLQTNCNIASSAKQLFIHRNSMIYRIKQLEEKYHIDFNDPETRLQLLVSFEIYDNTKWFSLDKYFNSTLLNS